MHGASISGAITATSLNVTNAVVTGLRADDITAGNFSASRINGGILDFNNFFGRPPVGERYHDGTLSADYIKLGGIWRCIRRCWEAQSAGIWGTRRRLRRRGHPSDERLWRGRRHDERREALLWAEHAVGDRQRRAYELHDDRGGNLSVSGGAAARSMTARARSGIRTTAGRSSMRRRARSARPTGRRRQRSPTSLTAMTRCSRGCGRSATG